MSVNANRNSTPPLSVPDRMILRMKAYSSFQVDQIPEYRKGFTRMVNEFGALRTDKGITAAIDATPDGFPPSVGKIRSMIPPAEEFKFCGSCQNGWVVVNPEAKPSEWKAKRCGCATRL